MIHFLLIPPLLFFMNACSFQSPPNHWQYKSSNAFKSYSENFLQAHTVMAKNDFQRAQEHARMSADLRVLARIYLGKCGLNKAVGIDDACKEYLQLKPLLDPNSLDSYYHFIQNNGNVKQIQELPKQYHEFAQLLAQKEYAKAFEAIVAMQNVSSQLLAASLIKEHLHEPQKEKILRIASFHGYKKAALFWLEEIKNSSDDLEKIKLLELKITLLKKGIE